MFSFLLLANIKHNSEESSVLIREENSVGVIKIFLGPALNDNLPNFT